MRRIVTAISAAALALSMVAQAIPAYAQVTGYDSSFRGESAFLFLDPGDTGTFFVFFANTGTTAWTRDTTTQVNLVACLEDKVTCNAQDADEATFNNGQWLSTTAYATHSQTSVAPGQLATFTYNVTAPSNAAAGVYRFNGDLANAGVRIHPEGYYQDVEVTGELPADGAATLTALNPTQGDVSGGTSVTLTGTGFVCTPSFPAVTFDTSAATVTSCGSTTLVATSPAHAAGNVEVRVTNSGAAASNALLFTYRDLTAPTYDSVNPLGGTNQATLTFSESVCRNAAFAAGDYAITVNGLSRNATGDGAVTTNCGTTTATGTTSFNVSFDGTALVAGDFVAVQITAAGAAKIEDLAGNEMAGAQTRTGSAQADTARPSITAASARSSTTIRLTYNEAVKCSTDNVPDGTFLNQFRATTGTSSLTPTGATCPASATFGGTTITLTFGSNISAGGSVSYTESTTAADRVVDVSGNRATSPQSITYTALTADTTAPRITDARVTVNTGTSNFNDAGDTFTLTFDEDMDTSSPTAYRIQVQDSDPGATKGLVEVICADAGNASCTWDTAGRVLTVVIGGDFAADIAADDGTTAGLQLPLTITATTEIKDEAGNAPNLSQSDRLID